MNDLAGFRTFLKHAPGGPYFFDDSLVEHFFDTASRNTLTIVGGPSGSGKSTLCSLFVDYMSQIDQRPGDSHSSNRGASLKGSSDMPRAKKVPVSRLSGEKNTAKERIVTGQSTWNTKEHLCGYLDSEDTSYMVTPFVDNLLQALRDRTRQYYFLIDSVDLGNIEGFLSDVIASIASHRPMPLHNCLRCVPLSTALPEERNLICHNDCFTCFFASIQFDAEKIPTAMVSFAPPHVAFPDNFHIIGTLLKSSFVEAFQPWMVDKINWVHIPSIDSQAFFHHLRGAHGDESFLTFLHHVFALSEKTGVFLSWRIIKTFCEVSQASGFSVQDLDRTFKDVYLPHMEKRVHFPLEKTEQERIVQKTMDFCREWGFDSSLKRIKTYTIQNPCC